MGGIVTRLAGLSDSVCSTKALPGADNQVHVVMVGLSMSGKTTILHKLGMGEVKTTSPVIFFALEQVQSSIWSLSSWDVDMGYTSHPVWQHYLSNADGLIFVVDSICRDRATLDMAAGEFRNIMSYIGNPAASNTRPGIPILVFANKQDLSTALSPAKVGDELSLPELRNHKWHVQGTVGMRGEGLHEGLDWLASAINASACQGVRPLKMG